MSDKHEGHSDNSIEVNLHGFIACSGAGILKEDGLGFSVKTEYRDEDFPPCGLVVIAAKGGIGGYEYHVSVEQARALANLLLDAANDVARNTGAQR